MFDHFLVVSCVVGMVGVATVFGKKGFVLAGTLILAMWPLFHVHFVASDGLADLREEFSQIAASQPNKVTTVALPDGGEARVLSYGGKLDAVLERRDQFLSNRGLRGFGSWRVVNDGQPMPLYAMVYIHPAAAVPVMCWLAVVATFAIRRSYNHHRLLAMLRDS